MHVAWRSTSNVNSVLLDENSETRHSEPLQNECQIGFQGSLSRELAWDMIWYGLRIGKTGLGSSCPYGGAVKSPPANAGEAVSISGLERSLGGGNGNPLQYSCLKNSMDREPARLQSMGSQRVGHNWATKHTHVGDSTYALWVPIQGPKWLTRFPSFSTHFLKGWLLLSGRNM